MSVTLENSLGPNLTAEQAEEIYRQGKEAVTFALLVMAKRLAEVQGPPTPTPSTPSAMVPPYQKPSSRRGAARRTPAENQAMRARGGRLRRRFTIEKNIGPPAVRIAAAN